MSRLESFIRRMTAQRDCLNEAARRVADLPGPFLELGLGNGRTYDHLREIGKGREIFAFDRHLAAHPDCIPDEAHMLLGEFADTLPGARERIGAGAVLVHCDFGTGVREDNLKLAAWLGPRLLPLLAPGGVVVSDQALDVPELAQLPLPKTVAEGRYYMYRRT